MARSAVQQLPLDLIKSTPEQDKSAPTNSVFPFKEPLHVAFAEPATTPVTYVLIRGIGRLRAARKAKAAGGNVTTVPCMIFTPDTPDEDAPEADQTP